MKASKLRVTDLYEGNSWGTGEFPAQMASNAENVSIWWRLHENSQTSTSKIWKPQMSKQHYRNVIISAMVSEITGVSIICPTDCSGPDQREYHSSASLAFMKGIHQ